MPFYLVGAVLIPFAVAWVVNAIAQAIWSKLKEWTYKILFSLGLRDRDYE